MHTLEPTAEQREWLASVFASLPEAYQVIRPSQWAETQRYLPPQTTHLAGLYRFDVTPYLREILDCLSVDSPVREVVVMKGVQIGATVGVLENAIGYFISHVKSAPCMLVTADAELAKLRVEGYVTPMLEASNLTHLIRSNDLTNTRKTGKTDKRIEWEGGGSLIPFGAQNANKLRSVSIQMLLRDEIDGWPDSVGKDGDPMKLSADRTASYESSRKILDISTPLLHGTSKIARRFLLGDQRYYNVRCLHCEHLQVLRWRTMGPGGVISGMTWELDDYGHLVHESARWLCEKCQHPHTNDDKTRLLSPSYGAEWVPTAKPSSQFIRSYHLSALYSPPGMQSWDACVLKWLDAWDDEHNRPRKIEALQVFYNNVLGKDFEIKGERPSFEAVSGHRRSWYRYGEIPNKRCEAFCGGPVLVVVCTVDVHGDNLAVSVWGWCRDHRPLLLDYDRIYGDTSRLDDETWRELGELIETKIYTADDGREYNIAVSMIDSGYRTDTVYQFCAGYEGGVYPVKGRDASPKHQREREFSDMTTPMGTTAYGITVDFYKDRWSTALRRSDWSGQGIQPETYFNAPQDATDKQLKELTVETKVQRIDPRTKERVGWEWRRPSGAANELWDLLVYSNAALDVIAWDLCINQHEMPAVSWPFVWETLLERLDAPTK